MRAIYPSSESVFSISELARGTHEIASISRITVNDVDADALDEPAISGLMLASEVQPGLIATGYSMTFLNDNYIEFDVESSLGCGMLLAGEADPVQVVGHRSIRYEIERPLVIGFGKPVKTASTIRANQTAIHSGFMLRPAFFERFGSHVADDGLARLKSFLNTEFQSVSLPKTRKVTEIARRNLFHPYGGELRELFLETNTLNFVIEIAELFKESQRIVGLIGAKHYDRVMHAREILDANLATPPKSLDLARQVGVSLTTLQAHFKTAFGVSIFGYVRTQRLALARSMLHESDISVAEVAYQVGFSNPTAFTAAYRRHFGEPPTRDTRRR